MSQEAWLNAKGISSIRSPSPEKTSNMWSDLAVLDKCQNIPIFVHVLDVFSGLGYRIELIPFPLSQASWDTSLDYPQGAFWRQKLSDYFDPIPLLWGLKFKHIEVKKIVPMVPREDPCDEFIFISERNPKGKAFTNINMETWDNVIFSGLVLK